MTKSFVKPGAKTGQFQPLALSLQPFLRFSPFAPLKKMFKNNSKKC
jgi:hypothetical protein